VGFSNSLYVYACLIAKSAASSKLLPVTKRVAAKAPAEVPMIGKESSLII
jgi:hypothetical protein